MGPALLRSAKPPFDRLVAAHGRTVLRVCRAVLAPADADDAWQETFLAALRAYPDLDDDANHEAWLVTIAHRKAIDAVRASARRAVPVATVPECSEAAPPADHGDDLRAAIDGLTDRQRAVVLLHHVAGLPHAEVAAITGSSPAAVRRAGSDAMAALRRALTDGDDT